MQCKRDNTQRRRQVVRTSAVLLVVLALTNGAAQTPTSDEPPAADRVTAILTPHRQAVLSAEVSARVAAINRDLGESFASGDVLLQLDDLLFRVNQQSAEARLAWAERELARVRGLADGQTRERRAQAVLAAARVNLEAMQHLFKDGHASQVDVENARRDATTAQTDCELAAATSAKDLAEAEREQALAQARLEAARDELAACTVTAPYGGRVARVLVHEHEFVQRGMPVIEVVDDTVLRAKFLLPSSLFRDVHVGQVLTLTVVETGETVDVTVAHVAAVLDAASATFEVYAEVDNRAGALRAGMNGWLRWSQIGTR